MKKKIISKYVYHLYKQVTTLRDQANTLTQKGGNPDKIALLEAKATYLEEKAYSYQARYNV